MPPHHDLHSYPSIFHRAVRYISLSVLIMAEAELRFTRQCLDLNSDLWPRACACGVSVLACSYTRVHVLLCYASRLLPGKRTRYVQFTPAHTFSGGVHVSACPAPARSPLQMMSMGARDHLIYVHHLRRPLTTYITFLVRARMDMIASGGLPA